MQGTPGDFWGCCVWLCVLRKPRVWLCGFQQRLPGRALPPVMPPCPCFNCTPFSLLFLMPRVSFLFLLHL